MVRYDYISPVPSSVESLKIGSTTIYEDISLRTADKVFFPEIPAVKIYSGDHFEKVNGEWHNIETATATIDQFKTFNAISPLSYLKNFFSFQEVQALATSSYAGTADCVMGIAENASWSTIWSATSGSAPDTADLVAGGYLSGGKYSIYRSYLPFYTNLGSDITIGTSSLFLYAETINDSDNDGKDYIAITKATFNSTYVPVAGDYDMFGTDLLTSKFDITGWSAGYKEFPLNATGTAWINKTGSTQFGVREDHDLENEAFSVGIYTRVRFHESETAGTAYDPYLLINYSLPVPEATSSDCMLATTTAPTNNNIGTIASYTDGTYTYYSIPFFVWVVLAVCFVWVGSKVIWEFVIRLRKKT